MLKQRVARKIGNGQCSRVTAVPVLLYGKVVVEVEHDFLDNKRKIWQEISQD
jgi:hypothetical protein